MLKFNSFYPRYPRRKFLKHLGLAGVGILAACSTPANNTTDNNQPVKIGAMYLLTGGFATYGEFARDGINLALTEINTNGGINGRTVEVIFEHEGDPVQTARRLVLEENVDFLIGIDSSGNAEALVPTLPELDRVLMVTHAATPKITGELCNKYIFRCSINGAQNATAGADIATKAPYLKWTTIGPDYAFGHQSWDFFQKAVQQRQPDIKFLDKTAFPTLGAEDYNSFITTLTESNADAIWCSLWGNDLVNFVRQANKFGLFAKFPVYMELGAAMEVLTALGAEMPIAQWVGTRYWWQTPDTEINRNFVQKFRDRYNSYPSYNAQNAYVGLHLLAAAANDAKTTKTEAVIQALEGREYEAPMGKVTIRATDHQAIVDVTWGKTANSTDYEFPILDPIQIAPGNSVTRPVNATSCQL
ncbi:MAG: ABC transporter substrate-binding protein [Okeania sp. SIO2F4]|uniref:ABC transporter substrate-binding protein n=1 Tax=Okeania sp. SIO2F4 TaxID=2607790 RepID=UPI001429511A|nr:ABC transporter substrate-binding protein [Okeania sp. SIO2F4]NES06560.1 ABC transporter substrate-binding protein [Okeania sp. SIO2F4]